MVEEDFVKWRKNIHRRKQSKNGVIKVNGLDNFEKMKRLNSAKCH